MERPAIPCLRRHAFRLPAVMALGAAGALLALSSPLFAQDAGAELPEGNSPEEVAQRKAANEQQAQFAAGQLKANADSQAEYERGLKAVEEAKVKIAADEAAAQAAYEAEKSKREQEYQAAMAKWRDDVEACKKGDVSRCGTAPATQP
ncbi:hypothetical protein H0274_02790 [Altererythrobacter sp. CC-YST694]|uniref:hypothetical protein n=1 Tax=Altererythrobacter sp. CC-YST694 TaxID=2755038 RepID=UPI001D006965|nr:hypothetical protein [Altererythrobacter sp. CC-YST694]MCB5424175.1 hypothetical protein [Altererythrobacter sp. CC-YST694]